MKLINYPENAIYYFSHDVKNEDVGEQTMPLHYHDLFEIYFLESGSCNYFIDNKSYHLVKGDIAIIPAGTIHYTLYKNSRYSRMLINFSSRFIPASVIPLLKTIRYIYRNEKITQDIYVLLKKMEEEYKNGGELSEDVLCAYMHILFFSLARNENEYDDKTVKNEYVEKALDFVRNNYSNEEVSLSRIAKKFSVSPEHFSREFKKETGFGFCEYVNILRLKKAEKLIKQNEKLSITEISQKCGFNDSNYFSVRFKKMYGISPKRMQQTFSE